MAFDLSPLSGRGIWKVELHGQRFDLEDLGVALGDTGTVERDGQHWYLTSSSFPNSATPREVKDCAERLTDGPLAVLTATSNDFAGVRVGELVFERVDGHRDYVTTVEPGVVQITGTAIGRSRAVAVGVALGNSAPPPPDPLAKRARLYTTDPQVRRALDFFNRADETFSSIYKAFEIVRDDLGGGQQGENEAARRAGVAPDDVRVFDRNAHSPLLTGDLARHAETKRPRRHPGVRSMSLQEARSLVRTLLFSWIDAKP
jgi:hypothetical protein